jgi:UDP-N-acetylmuramate: L-alanyl-gamma-D-glutamyl-meso-diaminopimelate ligase
VSNGREESLERVLRKGCWTAVERIGVTRGWQAEPVADGSAISFQGEPQGILNWNLLGEHNRMNALAAIAAARHAGVPATVALEALRQFKNVKRRMEVRGEVREITVYDDFAHHPTAIRTTLEGLRDKVNGARIIAVLEPRSNTMKMGVWKEGLAPSLAGFNLVFCYSANTGWDVKSALAPLGSKALIHDDLDALVTAIVLCARRGDHILIMSNGAFGGVHEKLLKALEEYR